MKIITLTTLVFSFLSISSQAIEINHAQVLNSLDTANASTSSVPLRICGILRPNCLPPVKLGASKTTVK
ncbi:MAG: hypothetical protein GY928_03090 [Colwellia sp.]|nr:hypothetical protein [Colwellia sp.]